MAHAGIIGSTGLVGSHILEILSSHPAISQITSLSRRAPSSQSSKVTCLSEADASKWPTALSISPFPSIFFSSLGTTKASAGSIEKQREIDYDLNLSVAQTAKKNGTKVFVLISVGAASASSMFAYPKMKGQLEEAVKALEFESTVIVRPGLIVGDRQESRPAEGVFRKIASGLGSVSPLLKNFWAQDADVIAKAAVSAGLQGLEGEGKKGVTVLEQADIVRLGKTEWKS